MWCWWRNAASTAARSRTRSPCSTSITNMPTSSRWTRSSRILTAWRCGKRADMKPRDYGPFDYSPIISRPRLTWPNGERVALWVIPNIEYFSLQERPGGYRPAGQIPDLAVGSDRDYRHPVGVLSPLEVGCP